ncbi:protein spaetzle-like isoform X2 [Calliphora vicina]|uniref:protein spaetzle-like isoform X2 n=1 Tax=Calliphora vicina TaxID=7373 RepID=UPI00325B5C18
MAQFLTLLPVLLLLVAVFNPIVCPSSQMYNERRDRAPYIESSEHSPQYLRDSDGPNGSRLRKAPSYKDNHANYRSQEQLSASPPASYGHHPAKTNGQDDTDSIVDKNIRSVFSTNFGSGLYLFKNTVPFVNQPHFNSYADQMIGDQPDPYAPPSSTSSSDKEFFKVQRSPNGKLSLVYNEDFVPQEETDINKTNNTADNQSSSSHNESFENRFQTHFPGGLPLKKDKIETSPSNVDHTLSKDSVHFPTEEPEPERTVAKRKEPVDTNDCVEKDGATNGKPFCTQLRNYPEKSHLEQIIKQRFSNLESFFGEDLVLPQNISQRMNNEPNEEFLCKSRVRVIYPQAGVDREYNWLVIVNIPKYKQGIRIEECINEGSTCGENTGLSLPNRYKATCKQSYIYRSLVAYTSDDTVIKEQFKMPSCCKCVLRTDP